MHPRRCLLYSPLIILSTQVPGLHANQCLTCSHGAKQASGHSELASCGAGCTTAAAGLGALRRLLVARMASATHSGARACEMPSALPSS